MQHEKFLRMIELADEIMGMCGGDAWERECTKDARAEYNILKDELDRELGRGNYDPIKLNRAFLVNEDTNACGLNFVQVSHTEWIKYE